MDDVFDINKTITALDILQTNGFSVLYFGTKDGQLGMVYLQLGGKRENFTTKIVSVANTKIINIKVEKDSVYYITEKKLGKIDINDCSIHKDCESCMNSFNLSCGWDYDENRCNINNSYSSVWISSENGNCIYVSNITGHIKIDTTVAVSATPAYIDDLQYTEDDNQFSLIVGLLTGGLVTSIIFGIAAVIISRRNTNRAVKKCKMEMSIGLSERREISRNDKELGHIEESEMAFSEINPVAELNSDSSIINHRPVNIEYERLGHRPLTIPFNHLQHLAADNQIRDIKNIGNRTVSPSDYMNLKL